MKKTITITIDESTYNAIKKKAAVEKRTFSNQVDWILSDFVFKNLKRHPNRPTKQEYQERNRQEPEEERKEKLTLERAVEEYKMVIDQGLKFTPKEAFESYEYNNEIDFSFEQFTKELKKLS